MSFERALKIASQIHEPVSVAAFVAVLMTYPLIKIVKSRMQPQAKWLLGFLALAILILGLAPIASSTFLKSRGIYRVRVVVLGPDKLPVEDAQVNSSSGGEAKKIEGGWEFDIPLETRPADGKEVLVASVRSAFLTGSSTVVLAEDYYPTATIQLTHDTSAKIRGIVEDERRRSVAGATVWIIGYGDSTLTDSMGNFVLPAHAADGQIVQIRALKQGMVGNQSAPAGAGPVEIIVRRP